MTFAWRCQEERRSWRRSGLRRRRNLSRPQLEMLEARLAPSGNVLPAIHFPVQDFLAHGEVLSASGSFSDPQGNSWIAQVDYGDGAGLVPLPLQADHTFLLNHTYAREGNFEVSVIVDDNLGASALATLNVHARALPGVPAGIATLHFPASPLIAPGPPPPNQVNTRSRVSKC